MGDLRNELHTTSQAQDLAPPLRLDQAEIARDLLPTEASTVSLPFNVTLDPLEAGDILGAATEALKSLFPGESISVPESPIANGGLGAVYKIRVGDQALKLKMVGANCVAALRSGASVAPLEADFEILSRGVAALPIFRGAIVDTPREGAPRMVVALVTEWVEGRFLKELLEEGTLTKEEAKAMALKTIEELRSEGVRILDSDPSNYCVVAGPPLRARYIDAGMCRYEPCPDDPEKQKRWHHLALGVLMAIDRLVPDRSVDGATSI